MNTEISGHDSQSEMTLASQCIRTLLERHGVPRNKHSAVLSDVLKLSYSQANRRLTTPATWALEELRALAESYGETLTDLVALGERDDSVDATLSMGLVALPCRVTIGAAVHKPRVGALVATKIDSQWVVMVANHSLDSQAYDIKRLIVEPSPATSRRIAVLDDHPDSAQLVVSYLETAGFDPVAFTSLERIAASTEHFDGYVLDWIIVKDHITDTVRELVANIRSRDAHCPIVVLTGQMRSGVAAETEIATAMARYRLKFFEKPAPLPMISAALAASFAPA